MRETAELHETERAKILKLGALESEVNAAALDKCQEELASLKK